MSNRKPIIAMNWAMRQNKNSDAIAFAEQLVELLDKDTKTEKIIFPSMGTLQAVAKISNETNIELGAQNIAPYAHGEYSGEYSIESLIDIGGKYVELGHWERRTLFGETDELINKKAKLILENNLIPIICVGETDKFESKKEIEEQIRRQLFNDLLGIEEKKIETIIIAYTPKWAVGKTRASNAPHVHEVGNLIREILRDIFSEKTSQIIRVIYGGSVSPENARLIVEAKSIDGVLIGRFGSNPERYAEVVKIIEDIKET
ncbi:triose-phosphate isomerase family protein [Enterococcus xiangfangensis]|uniref:Triosephosphate isomerase n=1 Tax=Enterococcus xiangfangensis TaxID=1296537 RepID=A0ABU3FBY2_9ENTE|nr:triose-phosphate isomerase [Enterococcus xiangfangensis]MDT2759906.1 triose-phosphate isomerase [Enterococcus xiangfangensis]